MRVLRTSLLASMGRVSAAEGRGGGWPDGRNWLQGEGAGTEGRFFGGQCFVASCSSGHTETGEAKADLRGQKLNLIKRRIL